MTFTTKLYLWRTFKSRRKGIIFLPGIRAGCDRSALRKWGAVSVPRHQSLQTARSRGREGPTASQCTSAHARQGDGCNLPSPSSQSPPQPPPTSLPSPSNPSDPATFFFQCHTPNVLDVNYCLPVVLGKCLDCDAEMVMDYSSLRNRQPIKHSKYCDIKRASVCAHLFENK